MAKQKQLALSLEDNALDYVLSAAEQVEEGDARNIKYAILHLFAGIELLLKARLQRVHWSLLFDDVDKAQQSAIQSGDFKSVDFDGACERLKKIGQVTLDKSDLEQLKSLRLMRNKVQHFAITVNEAEAKALLGLGASFVIEFCKQHLPELLDSHKQVIEDIRTKLVEFQEFVAERLKAIQPILDVAPHLWDCPNCMQETLMMGIGDDPKCAFCDQTISAEQLAIDHDENGAPATCPECRRSTCSMQIAGDGIVWICTSCFQDFDGDTYIEGCSSCGCLIKNDETYCSECFHDKVAEDDD